MKIEASGDFWSGLIFAVFGISFVAVARDYPLGSALSMGPAYFPTMVGGLLALLGLILVARSLFVAGAPVSKIGMRALFLVIGSLILFGYLVDKAGLIAAVVALVFVSASGGHEFHWREVSIVAAVLAMIAVAVFYYGLDVPFTLGPEL